MSPSFQNFGVDIYELIQGMFPICGADREFSMHARWFSGSCRMMRNLSKSDTKLIQT